MNSVKKNVFKCIILKSISEVCIRVCGYTFKWYKSIQCFYNGHNRKSDTFPLVKLKIICQILFDGNLFYSFVPGWY